MYMPEKDHVLMLVYLDYRPCKPACLHSDDGGRTWSEPRLIPTNPRRDPAYGDTPLSPAYLGNGKVMFSGMEERWFSDDFGTTWYPRPLPPGANGKPWAGWQWEPPHVDRDPATGKVIRIAETAYSHEGAPIPPPDTSASPISASATMKASPGHLKSPSRSGGALTKSRSSALPMAI